MKDQLKNPLVQQYILEIALPLVGYLFFDWSISVIIAFYFIDYFCSEIVRHRRHYKIMTHWNESKKLFFLSLTTSILVFAGLSFYVWTMLGMKDPVTNLHLLEIEEFAKSEGWFLIPIVYLANYMKDVMTFYAPRRFAKYNFRKTLKNYFLELVVMTVLVVAGIFVWYQFDIPDVPALLGFVVVKLGFDFLLVNRLKKSSMKAN